MKLARLARARTPADLFMYLFQYASLVWLSCFLAFGQSLAISAGCLAGCTPAPGFVNDEYFVAGSSTQPIAAGAGIFAQVRYGATVAYDIPRLNGFYDVAFDLEEPSQQAAGLRVFTISANGAATAPIDLFFSTGFMLPAKPTLRVLVLDGHLRISEVATARTALVNGIEITPVPATQPVLLSLNADGTFGMVTLGPTIVLVNGALTTNFTVPLVAQMWVYPQVVSQTAVCPGPPALWSPREICTGLTYLVLSNGAAYFGEPPPVGFVPGSGWQQVTPN